MRGNYKGCVKNRFTVFLAIFAHIVMDCLFVIGWLFAYCHLQGAIDWLSPSSTERLLAAGLIVLFEGSTLLILVTFIIIDLRRFVILILNER